MNPAAASEDKAFPPLAFVVGPTAVGKTAFALALAERLDAEIVNADSRQLYREMALGTAQPTAAERARVPHHLVAVASVAAPLDAAGFARLARSAIAEIHGRGRRVLVVGGSGLYLRVLRGGIFAGPAASAELRQRLQELAATHGVAYLHARLATCDPASAVRIGGHDLQRIVRALEVFEVTGVSLSEHHRRHGEERRAAHATAGPIIGLTLPRAELYRAIERRFDAMLAAGLIAEVRGLIAEVRGLLAAGITGDAGPLATVIGYREIAAFIAGRMSLDEATARAKQASRRLAKRQLTWFRREAGLCWFDPRLGVEPVLDWCEENFTVEREALYGN